LIPFATFEAFEGLKPVKYLRFADLVSRGFVRNRQTLANWIATQGFPAGVKLGPNCRVWPEPDVDAWLEQRA
jgi:predicted DNA-binding transcriptional regulator AlpA